MKFSISLLWLMALHCSLFAQDRDKDWPQLDGFSERQSRSEVTYEPPFVFEKRVDAGFSIESFSYVDGVVYFASAGVDNLFGAVDLRLKIYYGLLQSQTQEGVLVSILRSQIV